jgi:hypothetical protein
MPAVCALFALLQPLQNVGQNIFLRGIVANNAIRIRQVSKYRHIWKLGVLLDFIRRGLPSSKLAWNDLLARTAAIFMIFIP